MYVLVHSERGQARVRGPADDQVDWGYRNRWVVGQVGDSITGGRSGRQGLVGGRVVGQARGRHQEGKQAGKEPETGEQTGRQGLNNRRVVRQARVQ